MPWTFSVSVLQRTPQESRLHAVLLCVCGRVLFEVASLEREAALPHEACLRHLAVSVRTCHKIHGFAGGFEHDQSELFDKASLHCCRLHVSFCCASFVF